MHVYIFYIIWIWKDNFVFNVVAKLLKLLKMGNIICKYKLKNKSSLSSGRQVQSLGCADKPLQLLDTKLLSWSRHVSLVQIVHGLPTLLFTATYISGYIFYLNLPILPKWPYHLSLTVLSKQFFAAILLPDIIFYNSIHTCFFSFILKYFIYIACNLLL